MFSVFLIGIIGFGAAQVQHLGTFKQNNHVNLTQVCDNCTYVNITQVLYPNSSFALLGQYGMTKNGTIFYLEFNNTATIGTYIYTTCGDLNGVATCDSVDFEITPTGFIGTLGFYILILGLSIIIILMGILLQDGWIGVLGAFGLVLCGLFVILFGIDGMKDNAYTYGFGILISFLGAYLGVRGALEQIQ